MALNPEIISDSNWEKHCDDFFQKLLSIDGVRLPGSRRHKKRLDGNYRSINEEVVIES
jgi:delta1-piperideine-2-carboxylate reductase